MHEQVVCTVQQVACHHPTGQPKDPALTQTQTVTRRALAAPRPPTALLGGNRLRATDQRVHGGSDLSVLLALDVAAPAARGGTPPQPLASACSTIHEDEATEVGAGVGGTVGGACASSKLFHEVLLLNRALDAWRCHLA